MPKIYETNHENPNAMFNSTAGPMKAFAQYKTTIDNKYQKLDDAAAKISLNPLKQNASKLSILKKTRDSTNFGSSKQVLFEIKKTGLTRRNSID
jgi:hypothetical protein